MLVAGLAMMQMDANSENQMQALHETEMVTTQGLGLCKRVVGGKDSVGYCADKACFQIPSQEVFDKMAEIVAKPYMKCKGVASRHDCFEYRVFKDGKEILQICALFKEYAVICHPQLLLKTTARGSRFVFDRPGCNVVSVGSSS